MSARRIASLLTVCFGCLLAPAAASARSVDPDGFRLQSSRLYVHENAGKAVITIERRNASVEAQIRYIVIGLSAQPHVDYGPVKAMIDFAPGQSSARFAVPIVDHGVPSVSKTIKVALFGPSPIGLGTPGSAVLTIINDDSMAIARNVADPLGIGATARGNPLLGAHFFVDFAWSPAARLARDWHHSNPSASRQLSVIAKQPGTHRFGAWDGQYPGRTVSNFLARASIEEPGTVPMVSTYRITGSRCGGWSDSPAQEDAYHKWITSFANGLGAYRAVLFLEMDSLITVGCLSRQGVSVRMRELSDAIDVLTSHCPRLVIYLDAGAGDAIPAGRTASLLRRAGVSKIQGFFLNSTHYDWTSREIRFGQQVSRLIGGKHFVVNTGDNGRGPLVPRSRVRDGNEVLCNPPGRGLGPKPTADTGYRNVDALAWIGNPGESGGACVPGAPPTGAYWPAYALMLVRNADFRAR